MALYKVKYAKKLPKMLFEFFPIVLFMFPVMLVLCSDLRNSTVFSMHATIAYMHAE